MVARNAAGSASLDCIVTQSFAISGERDGQTTDGIEARPFAAKLRQTMRVSGTSVSLLTYCAENETPFGMAVTTASVLSMSPPSMLVVVRHAAPSYRVLEQAGRFCISFITAADLSLVDAFARPDGPEQRFSEGEWRRGWQQLPYLETALSSVFCATEAAHDYGEQRVFFGRIHDIKMSGSINLDAPNPLIWLNGRPGRVVYSESDAGMGD